MVTTEQMLFHCQRSDIPIWPNLMNYTTIQMLTKGDFITPRKSCHVTSDSYLICPSVDHLSPFKEPFVKERSPSSLPARVRQTYWKSFHSKAAIKEKISQAMPQKIETSHLLESFDFTKSLYTVLKISLSEFRFWICNFINISALVYLVCSQQSQITL